MDVTEFTEVPPHVILKPDLIQEGETQWCALYGMDWQSGVAGFGRTKQEALEDFDRQWEIERERAIFGGW